MRTVAYVRVSTEEQAQDGVSLDAQREKIEAYAKLYGLEIIAWIEDAGQSAKSLERPGLQRALMMLRRKEVDALVVAKLDRLSRSVSDWDNLVQSYFCEKKGRQLLSVSDQIDTRTAAGRLVLNVLMCVAQWEREAIGERTRDALQHKRRRGELVGSVPYGSDLSSDGKTLITNQMEQITLALIKQLKSDGKSLGEIASELNGLGIPTKTGASIWQRATVNRILHRVL